MAVLRLGSKLAHPAAAGLRFFPEPRLTMNPDPHF
jgi:hypothetical protein